ncbi:MAG: hypothetical protein OQK99_10650 [Gammaproteobacteria bacterium]|jgi:hypothetical protein|nr:hypothetical protein [Gammaproteobacteria bacterium]
MNLMLTGNISKKFSGKGRLLALFGLLALVVGAGAVVPAETADTAATVETAETAEMKVATMTASVSEGDQQAQDNAGLPVRPAHAGVSADLFNRQSWYTPPPPAPVVRQVRQAAPAAPTAPPLPFTVMGSYEQDDETLYFLVKGDRVFDAKEGDILEGTYRVDGVSNGQLRFTYLPLDISQGLQLGDPR